MHTCPRILTLCRPPHHTQGPDTPTRSHTHAVTLVHTCSHSHTLTCAVLHTHILTHAHPHSDSVACTHLANTHSSPTLSHIRTCVCSRGCSETYTCTCAHSHTSAPSHSHTLMHQSPGKPPKGSTPPFSSVSALRGTTVALECWRLNSGKWHVSLLEPHDPALMWPCFCVKPPLAPCG